MLCCPGDRSLELGLLPSARTEPATRSIGTLRPDGLLAAGLLRDGAGAGPLVGGRLRPLVANGSVDRSVGGD